MRDGTRNVTGRRAASEALAERAARNRGSTDANLPAAGLYVGEIHWATDTLRKREWDGTGWVIMAEPAQADTTLCITGVNADGGLTSKTTYHRSDGYIDVESITVFASGPSTLASLAWVPPKAGRTAAGNIPIGIGSNTLHVAFFDASAGSWADGEHNEGTTSISLFASFSHAFGAGTLVGIQAVSTTLPFAWTTSDTIRVWGRYPMATRYT